MIKRILLLLCATASLVVGFTACHTAHGAGEDISAAGNKIQQNTPP
jgi:predicted small secreted protein